MSILLEHPIYIGCDRNTSHILTTHCEVQVAMIALSSLRLFFSDTIDYDHVLNRT